MPKSEDLLRPMFNMFRLVTDYKFYLFIMRKFLLLSALIVSAVSAFATDVGEASPNAICITLKSGQTEFVAFSQAPQITSDAEKVYVTSTTDNTQLAIANIADVEKITAAWHDLTDGVSLITVNGETTTEIYNLDGTRVTNIVPGRVYIIKSNGTTKKVIK